jgi:hypothetical protein
MVHQIPAASDPTEVAADWVEFTALRSRERQVSQASLVKLLRLSGSMDAFEGIRSDAGSAASQIIVQDVFSELENRRVACGPDNYPFEIEQGLLSAKAKPERSPYVLLLLMSAKKPTAGHSGTAALFEHMCTNAALTYLGGVDNGAQAIRFGSPREVPFAKFSSALDRLCLNMAEGGGCKAPHKAKHTGDEGLDIVAWRKFPDSKEGQLIAFGQCAGGSGKWEKKLTELDGRKFAQKWLRVMFLVDPVRLFFVPRRIPKNDWEEAGIDGGILFDRCRIVACLKNPSNSLSRACVNQTRTLLKELRTS